MDKIRTFEDLVIWQEAHVLTLLIYEVTKNFPSSEKFNLTSQLRRAAVSVESCIAEGFSRFHYKERVNFYYDSRGSLGEIHSQLLDARDLRFITTEIFHKVYLQIDKTGVILGGLIRQTERLSSLKKIFRVS